MLEKKRLPFDERTVLLWFNGPECTNLRYDVVQTAGTALRPTHKHP